MHQSLESAIATAENQYKQYANGNPLITADGELIAAMPKEQRDQAQSQNDIAWEAYKQQIILAWNVKKRCCCFNNWKSLKGIV